jgi:hypothetical protein
MAIANADSPERIANIAVEDGLNLRHEQQRKLNRIYRHIFAGVQQLRVCYY